MGMVRDVVTIIEVGVVVNPGVEDRGKEVPSKVKEETEEVGLHNRGLKGTIYSHLYRQTDKTNKQTLDLLNKLFCGTPNSMKF